MLKQKGFSLIELLIVVAIILIIAAIAIPNLLRSRIAANEASAVGSLRTINTSEITYAATFPANGYAVALGVLGPGSTAGNTVATSAHAVLLDGVLGCPTATASGGICTKSGYSFYLTDTGASPTFYASNANPISLQTGTRYFYSDATGVIRYNTTTSATSTDGPLQ
ncbi:MAG: prepilin-type N-terminal cleavage/methylation domain-containing protein [Candidatus Korobacteraceae bacterium]|jgi:prepilin-type N-terminal cleavage/methylation domain-containing protein